MISLFRRVSRYSRRATVDPRENRLTESFAAILERVDGLAAGLVADWADLPAPEGQLHVQTQKTTLQAKFVDLELAFGALTFPQLRVWVEVKHGAGLGPEQLVSYEVDLEAESQGAALLFLLAPRRAMPLVQSSGARPIEWEQVARFLTAYRKQADLDPVQQWLLDEFLLYLKEEALSDEEALTSAHAFALSQRTASERAVARVLEFAESHIEKQWGEAKNSKKGYGVGWWASYPGPGPDWGSAWFEWALIEDENLSEPRNGLAFFAGVTFPSAKETQAQKPEWFAEIAKDGFERMWWHQWRVWRPLYPEYLLAVDSVAGQGARLGEWVVETFRMLEASRPQTAGRRKARSRDS